MADLARPKLLDEAEAAAAAAAAKARVELEAMLGVAVE